MESASRKTGKVTASSAQHPDSFRDEFYASLQSAARTAHGPIVLAQVDIRSLLTAVSAVDGDAAIYFVHTDARMLRDGFRSMRRDGLSRPVLYFHGTTQDFLRDIPTHPAAAAVPNGQEAFAFWQDLPAGATLVTGEPPGEEAHWIQAGFLERLAGARDAASTGPAACSARASRAFHRRFTGRFAPRCRRLFSALRVNAMKAPTRRGGARRNRRAGG